MYRTLLLGENGPGFGTGHDMLFDLAQSDKLDNTNIVDVRFSQKLSHPIEKPEFHRFICRLLPNMKNPRVIN